MLSAGEKAPINIQVFDAEGTETTLADHLNAAAYTVIYFYPKDGTPGCTKQACGFQDVKSEVEALNGQIIGISKDDPESHQKFAKNQNLKFTLLSDTEAQLQKEFGVWVERSMFGKKFIGTQRSCFILNQEGEILKVWEKASPKNNASEVIEFLKGRG